MLKKLFKLMSCNLLLFIKNLKILFYKLMNSTYDMNSTDFILSTTQSKYFYSKFVAQTFKSLKLILFSFG